MSQSYVKNLGFDKTSGSWQNLECTPTGILYSRIDGNVVVQGLQFSNTGALITTSSGGSGPGGDASSSNQLTQINLAETLNGLIATDLLPKIDLANGYLNDIEIGQSNLSLETTQNLVKNQLIASNVVLGEIKAATQLTAEELYAFRAMETPIKIESAYADVITQSAILGADTNPAFTQHPVYDGWYYTNSAIAGNSNLYFYANQTGQQKQYTIAECLGSYVVGRILTFTNVNTLPFLVIYSRPQGAGDAGPGFYRSRWIYRINNLSVDSAGMEFLMYAKTQPDSRIFPNVRRLEAVLISTVGPALETETLQFLTINTDSSATQNTVNVVYTAAGYNLMGTYHNLALSAGKQNEKVYLGGKLDLINQEATQQLIKTEVQATNSALADVNNTLQSIDTDQATAALQTDIKNELITLTNLGLATDAAVVSVDANLLLILDELQNGTIAVDTNEPWEFDNTDGGLVVHVANSTGGGGTATDTLQQDQLDQAIEANVAVCLRLDAINGVIDSIDGKITTCDTSTLLTEATFEASNTAVCIRLDGSNSILQDFQTNGIKSLVYAGGFPIDSTMYTTGRQALSVSIENNAVETSVNNFPTTYASDMSLTASNTAVCIRLDAINSSVQSLTPGGSSNSNVVVLNTVNTHIYGFHNDTFIPIHVNGVGHLIVDGSTHDGNGEAITSHLVGADRGLDSYIINPSIEVSNIWLSNIGSIDTKATIINTSIGQTNTILSGQTIQLNDIILETQTNNTKTQAVVDNTSTINSSIGTTNSYLASGNILLDDIKTEAQTTNTHLTTIESGLATIESTIGTATQKVSLYSANESPLNATSNALNIYQTNNPTSTNITASDTALTATSNALNIHQTNVPTSINITASGSALLATSSALNSYLTNPKITVISPGSSALGFKGNLWNNASVATQGTSTFLVIDEFTRSVISYEDTSIAATSDILVFGKSYGGGDVYQYLGKLIPILSSSLSKRFASGIFMLNQFQVIYLYNNSTTQALTNVYASVTSEYIA